MDGIAPPVTARLALGTALRDMVSQGAEKVERWKMGLECESTTGAGGWDKSDPRWSITRLFGQVRIPLTLNFGTENREKYAIAYSNEPVNDPSVSGQPPR